MNKTLRKCLILCGKLVVAGAMLVWAFWGIDLSQFVATVKGADLSLLAAALAGFVVSLVVIAFRLRMLLRVQDIEIGLWELIRLTFLGQFCNAVVPGVVGGDLVKAYYAAKHTPHKGAATLTVLVDRLMGLTELVLLAVVMLIWVWATKGAEMADLHRPAIAAGAGLTAVVVMLVLVLSPSLRRILRFEKLYSRLPIAGHIQSAGDAARRFGQNPGALLKAIAITLLAHGTWIFGIYLAGKSLHLATPWHSYFLYVPLIYIIGAVPITPGGAGLVEASYKLFFTSELLANHQVLSLALTARALDIIRGLPGLIVIMTGTKAPKEEQLQAELDADESSPVQEDDS